MVENPKYEYPGMIVMNCRNHPVFIIANVKHRYCFAAGNFYEVHSVPKACFTSAGLFHAALRVIRRQIFSSPSASRCVFQNALSRDGLIILTGCIQFIYDGGYCQIRSHHSAAIVSIKRSNPRSQSSFVILIGGARRITVLAVRLMMSPLASAWSIR